MWMLGTENLGILEELSVLFTAKPSLHPQTFTEKTFKWSSPLELYGRQPMWSFVELPEWRVSDISNCIMQEIFLLSIQKVSAEPGHLYIVRL